MPTKARIYWVIVCIAGVLSAIALQTSIFPSRPVTHWDLAAFILVALLVGGTRISLNRSRKGDSGGSMSLGFAITFATLLRFGPGTAVMIGGASCLSSCIFPKLQRWYRIVFNICLSAIEVFVGGLIFCLLMNWKMDASPGNRFVAVAGSAFACYAVNTGGVAIMIALHSGERLRAIWKENFSWTAPSYFASACIGAIAITVGSDFAVLFVIPIAYFIYQSYVTYISRSEERSQHIEEMQAKQSQLTNVYLTTIESLALAIDAKDQYTHSHIVRVQQYAMAIARELGLSEDELQAISTGALLHDIGKLGVPENVLLKAGPLTREEFEKIKQHPEIGAMILDPVEFPWPVLPIVRHHHEKWDGSGYPDGLAGEQIPLNARIMAVADVYDAVTSTRSYRQAWSHERAIDMMKRESGSHFDPKVVEAFLRVIDKVLIDLAAQGVGPLVKQEPMGPAVAGPEAKPAARIRPSSELWSLHEVARSVSGSLGIRSAARLVAQKIADVHSGAICVFLLWDSEQNRLNAECAFGPNYDFFVDAYVAAPESTSIRAMVENASYLGGFDPSDLVLTNGRAGETYGIKSALIVPVSCDGQAIGTINLYNQTLNAFSEDDRRALEAVAAQTAAAFYNGVAFNRMKSETVKDPLTGAYNVRFLTDHIDHLCEARGEGHPTPFSLVRFDLDGFQALNEAFGHAKGDGVLKDVARMVSEYVGEDGIVARSGADEFVVVLDHANAEDAASSARRIRNVIDLYDPGLSHPRLGQLKVAVSVGVASFPSDGKDCASLLYAADQSMNAFRTERRLLPLVRENEQAAGMNIYGVNMN